jgi:hypothetical protein
MKNIILISGILLVTLESCSKSSNEKQEFIDEIMFTEYSLDSLCQWANFEPNKVIIINSNEELGNYINCINENYRYVDFAEHSVLLLRGVTGSSPAEVMKKELQQISKNKYSLNLKIREGVLATPGHWIIAMVIPKLPQDVFIELNIRKTN